MWIVDILDAFIFIVAAAASAAPVVVVVIVAIRSNHMCAPKHSSLQMNINITIQINRKIHTEEYFMR